MGFELVSGIERPVALERFQAWESGHGGSSYGQVVECGNERCVDSGAVVEAYDVYGYSDFYNGTGTT